MAAKRPDSRGATLAAQSTDVVRDPDHEPVGRGPQPVQHPDVDRDLFPVGLDHLVVVGEPRAVLGGEHRAALSLLYRGALSRLAHGLGVPIEDSSTEGDCIRLAEATLGDERSAFAARLIGAWQLAIYGDRKLPTPLVLTLCDEFDRLLPARARPVP